MAKRPFTLNGRMTRATANKVFGLRIQRLKVRVLQGVPARTNRPISSEIRQKPQIFIKCLIFSRWYELRIECARLDKKTRHEKSGGVCYALDRFFGGWPEFGRNADFAGFLRPVAKSAASFPEILGHRPEPNQLIFAAFTTLGDAASANSAGAYCGHGRGFGGFRLVSGDRSQVLQPGVCHLQRRGSARAYRSKSLYSRGGTLAQKSTTKRPAKNNQLFGLFPTFGGGDGPKKGDLFGFVFDRCASRRGGRPELGRLGQVASAFGCFVGASPISHGAGTGRRRHKDRGAQSVASSPVLGGGFVGLASTISKDDWLFSSRRKSRFCDRNQAAALAGGFFAQSIQARSEESRLAGQPYATRFQAQLYYSRFSGRRGFSNRPKNYTPKPARHTRPVHAPELGGFLPGGEFNQIERASQSPLRGQLDHKN